jgi:hypothetical protein
LKRQKKTHTKERDGRKEEKGGRKELRPFFEVLYLPESWEGEAVLVAKLALFPALPLHRLPLFVSLYHCQLEGRVKGRKEGRKEGRGD